ncbi:MULTISPECIES: substrate-binding domain-containing protein [unclassified Polaromonas]|uniref:helix-turn-helix transcriptional regulator n=1 Tax=unclassified Polaromonas TaxID=2638319 RepID=UPI000F08478F|nr:MULTISPECIES: substrate-binding domain-containing protein [unclassified Polaromonas]AYQ26617.1 LysR family transcriptional regulator [Polaromonas sp. SP1]QGJ18538.1 LysR family transcriptional regulator [Polaromonas sp. Pch-P]
MHKVELSYLLTPQRGKNTLIRNPLMDLLHAVREQGSISKAAKALDLSYRHVWGALKGWEQTLGRTLIVWDKGQRARLTEFGEKLLWAERQAQARLAPQIEALRGDIERAFSTAFDDNAHVLTMYASHDAALTALRDQASPRGLHLDIRFMGSVDAIAALNAGRCMMAGFHTLDQPGSQSVTAQTYRNLLKPGLHKLIGFAHRTQGLIVAKNNPLGIAGIADLARPGVRYVNRAEGTGTRVLLDELLGKAGVEASGIQGYESQEPSHSAVAQAIAGNAADAGLGIETAAREKGLSFIPLAQERYHLVCLKSELPTPQVQALLKELQSRDWQTTLEGLPGYSGELAQGGKVLSLRATLPWWTYRKEKSDKNVL